MTRDAVCEKMTVPQNHPDDGFENAIKSNKKGGPYSPPNLYKAQP